MMKNATPLSRNTSSSTSTLHTKALDDPPILSEVMPLSHCVLPDEWVEAVCGVPRTTLEQWTSIIKAHNFFEDPLIDKALTQFCAAKTEFSRYAPLANLLNRLIELADLHQKEMKDLPAKMSIPDMVYFRNDPHYMIAPKHQGSLAAQRKPNVVSARRHAMENRKGGKGLEWYKAVLCFELEFEGRLLHELNARRKLSLLPDRKEDEFPEVKPSHSLDGTVV